MGAPRKQSGRKVQSEEVEETIVVGRYNPSTLDSAVQDLNPKLNKEILRTGSWSDLEGAIEMEKRYGRKR